jgi:hypothetical protein
MANSYATIPGWVIILHIILHFSRTWQTKINSEPTFDEYM